MKNDEFNSPRIDNEDQGIPTFEFGETPSNESSFYLDNDVAPIDELNDNPVSNEESSKPKQRKQEKQQEETSKQMEQSQPNVGSSSSSGSAGVASSTGAHIATVVGSSLVAVATLSTLVGIDLFYKGRCKMQQLDIVETSLVYQCTLEDLEEDSDIIIQLKNASFEQSQKLVEGPNEGVFEDLIPSTKYELAVIDLHYDNHILYQDSVVTMGEGEDTKGTVVISFVANNGTDETIEPMEIPYNTRFELPECMFSDPSDDMMFGGWDIGGGEHYNAGVAWNVRSDYTITATWIPCYRMVYHSNIDGEEVQVIKVKQDESVYNTLTECPFEAPEGMVFKNWIVDGNDVNPGDWISYEGDKDIYAYYDYLPTGEYKITFDSNGGSGRMYTGYGDMEEEYSLPECDFIAPDGYMFTGWTINGDLFMPGDEFTVEGDTVVTATWAQKEFERCIILEANAVSQTILARFDLIAEEGDLKNISIVFDDGNKTYTVPFEGELNLESPILAASVADLGLDLVGETTSVYRYTVYGEFLGRESSSLFDGTVSLAAINASYELQFPHDGQPIFYRTESGEIHVPMKFVRHSLIVTNEELYAGYKTSASGEMTYTAFPNKLDAYRLVLDGNLASSDSLTLYEFNIYSKIGDEYAPMLSSNEDLTFSLTNNTSIYFAYIDPFAAEYMDGTPLYLTHNLNADSSARSPYLYFKIYDLNDQIKASYVLDIDATLDTLINGTVYVNYKDMYNYDAFKMNIEKYAWSLDLCFNQVGVSADISVNIFNKNQSFTIG